MKFCIALLCLQAVFVSSTSTATNGSPMSRVVALIQQLKAQIEDDGKKEQQSYDKYACWCENTLARKAKDIADAKEQIESLQSLITKLGGEIAAHGAEIKQLNKDIAANKQAQKEATEMRNKENEEYSAEKTESEQCIGALEAAITALTGAGTGDKKEAALLSTMQQAQLMSAAAGVRGILQKSPDVLRETVSGSDMHVVQRFVEHPEDFAAQKNLRSNFAQVGNNPFGDYAPQSTQIQGILKGMYDAFASDLEKDNAEEAERQKAFEELMATKLKELATLEATHEKQTLDESEKKKTKAESRALLDATKKQLDADEVFFADTKEACKAKAGEWAERTRLRTEELQGIQKAIAILSGGEEKFQAATTAFVQVGAVRSHQRSAAVNAAYASLKGTGSLRLARVAAQVATGGHFDKVIAAIDKMIETLRVEEQDDIKHRDRCQRSENKNANEKEDLNSDIKKKNAAIDRMGDEKKATEEKIDELSKQIKATDADMEELLEMRNKDSQEFKKALKDDADSVKLLEEAIVSLSKFYKKNKIPLALSQQEPEYTVDPDKAPETSWSGSDYGGRKSESQGIIAILSMLKEDLEKEMKTGREEDAASQEAYEKDRAALQETLDAQGESKAAAEKELQDLEAQIGDTERSRDASKEDLSAEKKMSDAIGTDCSWVKTHFDSRREKRKVEMDGLVEAKNYLAGVESGDELA
jgi:hypothetical protein